MRKLSTLLTKLHETLEGGGYNLQYHDHLVEIFSSITEAETDEYRDVLERIRRNDWDRDAKAFQQSMSGSKHGLMLTPYSLSELRGMDTYKLNGYDIGFALKDHKGEGRIEIVAVHNNSGVRGIGKALMQAAKAKGGRVLDHFDGYLSSFYQSLGFKE